LFRLIEKAAKGKSFIITKAGKPIFTLCLCRPLTLKKNETTRVDGRTNVHPADFDSLGKDEVKRLFNGKHEAVVG